MPCHGGVRILPLCLCAHCARAQRVERAARPCNPCVFPPLHVDVFPSFCVVCPLQVVSYNLLAPLYVRPLDQRTGAVQPFAAFEWAEPADEVLAWDARWPRLQAELRACRADVLCLQEVQFELAEPTPGGAPSGAAEATAQFVLPRFLRELLLAGSEPDDNGATASGGAVRYVACVPPQHELKAIAERNARVLRCAAPVGNALLYRADRLEPLATYKALETQLNAFEADLPPGASVDDARAAWRATLDGGDPASPSAGGDDAGAKAAPPPFSPAGQDVVRQLLHGPGWRVVSHRDEPADGTHSVLVCSEAAEGVKILVTARADDADAAAAAGAAPPCIYSRATLERFYAAHGGRPGMGVFGFAVTRAGVLDQIAANYRAHHPRLLVRGGGCCRWSLRSVAVFAVAHARSMAGAGSNSLKILSCVGALSTRSVCDALRVSALPHARSISSLRRQRRKRSRRSLSPQVRDEVERIGDARVLEVYAYYTDTPWRPEGAEAVTAPADADAPDLGTVLRFFEVRSRDDATHKECISSPLRVTMPCSASRLTSAPCFAPSSATRRPGRRRMMRCRRRRCSRGSARSTAPPPPPPSRSRQRPARRARTPTTGSRTCTTASASSLCCATRSASRPRSTSTRASSRPARRSSSRRSRVTSRGSARCGTRRPRSRSSR